MDKHRLGTTDPRDGLWDWNLSSNRVHFSPRWIAMLGCRDDEIGTKPEEWLRRVHPEDQERVRREIDARLADGAPAFDIPHRMLHRNGTYRWMSCHAVVTRNERGQAMRLKGAHSDVTADHVADPLTGLPNRLLFLDHLARSIERATRQPDFVFAVLLVAIDQPLPDDSDASTAGQELLTAAARRLESYLRGADRAPLPVDRYVVARLGGDQFALLLDGLPRAADARTVAEAILAELLSPFRVRGRHVFLHPSIGIALSLTGYARTEDVLRDADAALYRATSLGGNRCEVFDTALLHTADEQLQLEADLEQALERRELVVFYQPILSLAANRIVGFEALVRWQHPTRGMIPPLEFIPIAEKTGAIVPLGDWVLREACRQLKAWQETLPLASEMWVSVNLSSVQFRQAGLVEQVASALRDAGLDPSCLVLELTESLAMEEPAAVKTVLMQLRMTGVRIGLDDFGTGHSALAYLHEFPADFLKVDQSFVRGMEARQDKADIVGTVAALAQQLGLHVIAEGIESQEGLALVRSLGCEHAQGFLFSRPIDADATAELLRNGIPPQAGLAADDEPTPDLGPLPPPASAAAARGRAQRLYVAVALGAVALLVSIGLPARWSGGATGADPLAAPRAVIDVTSSAASPRGPALQDPALPVVAATPPNLAAAGGASAISAKPSKPVTKPVATAANVISVPVVHQHVLGSCRGVLKVSPTVVSFTTAAGKDNFSLPRQQVQPALGDAALTLKAAGKNWRFEAADVKGKYENLAELRKLLKAITGA